MPYGPQGYNEELEGKSNTNTLIVIVVVTIIFILLGMFTFTSRPQSDNGLPDGVDKYGRSTQTQSQSQ